MKKTFSIALCLVMILSVFSVLPFGASAIQANANETSTAEGVTGDCTWQVNGTVLTISGSGRTADYDDADNKAPWQQYGITQAIIEDGVTEIGKWSFYNCSSMKSVSIPPSVTKISHNAFYSCSKLRNVVIHDIGAWCNITFGNYGSNPVHSARNLYLDDDILTEVTIPDSVTSIGKWTFSHCKDLTSITIPDSVVSIGPSAFARCYNLKNFTIPDSVTQIGSGAFSDCRSLTSVTIPDKVTSIGFGTFSECTGLTHITIGNSVESIESTAFWKCTSLTSVNIPDSVTSIDWDAFWGCTSLKNVNIPDSVTSISDSAFTNCPALNSVTIPDSVNTIGERAFGYLYDEEYGTVTKVSGFTIYGVPGSAAQTYADENGFIFKKIEDKPDDPGSAYLRGDYDNNGILNILDATRIQRILANLAENPGEDFLIGVDATGDDDFSIMDATRIQYVLAKIKNMDGTDYLDDV